MVVDVGFVMCERHYDEAGTLTYEYIRPDDDALIPLLDARRRQVLGTV
ncbi:MAG: hypothetical protein AB7O68_25085 [Pirellulales bacterium]